MKVFFSDKKTLKIQADSIVEAIALSTWSEGYFPNVSEIKDEEKRTTLVIDVNVKEYSHKTGSYTGGYLCDCGACEKDGAPAIHEPWCNIGLNRCVHGVPMKEGCVICDGR